MTSETVFKIGPFWVGLGFILLSIFTQIFIRKISDFFYHKSFYKNYILYGDKPEHMVRRAKMGSFILGCFGIIVIILVLKDYFNNP